jgi:Ca2+-transporting ATPase
VFDPDTQFLKSTHRELIDQRTLAFVALTMMQLTQSFLSRSVTESIFVTGVTANKWMVFAFFLSSGLLTMSIYIPGFNTFLGQTPIGGVSWGVVGVCVLIQVALVEVGKVFVRIYVEKERKGMKTVDSEPDSA